MITLYSVTVCESNGRGYDSIQFSRGVVVPFQKIKFGDEVKIVGKPTSSSGSSRPRIQIRGLLQQLKFVVRGTKRVNLEISHSTDSTIGVGQFIKSRPETQQERIERMQREFEAAKKEMEEKLTRQAARIRKQREALERKTGEKEEGARREKRAVSWLESLGYTSVQRTSPKAPGYDIKAVMPNGGPFEGEVKPKGELLTDPEGLYALNHQSSWRLIEYDRKTDSFEMFTYNECVWKELTRRYWKPYPVRRKAA